MAGAGGKGDRGRDDRRPGLREAARLRGVRLPQEPRRRLRACWRTSQAWLKYYYPAEFLCALFNNQPMGFYPPHVLINDAKRRGFRILPPDINQSQVAAPSSRATRSASASASSMSCGDEAAARIVAERAASGPYRSLADLVRRVPIRLEGLENLVAVGAAESSASAGARPSGRLASSSLPAPSAAAGTSRRPAPSSPSPSDRAGHGRAAGDAALGANGDEYDTMGLSPRYHPLGLLRPRLPLISSPPTSWSTCPMASAYGSPASSSAASGRGPPKALPSSSSRTRSASSTCRLPRSLRGAPARRPGRALPADRGQAATPGGDDQRHGRAGAAARRGAGRLPRGVHHAAAHGSRRSTSTSSRCRHAQPPPATGSPTSRALAPSAHNYR